MFFTCIFVVFISFPIFLISFSLFNVFFIIFCMHLEGFALQAVMGQCIELMEKKNQELRAKKEELLKQIKSSPNSKLQIFVRVKEGKILVNLTQQKGGLLKIDKVDEKEHQRQYRPQVLMTDLITLKQNDIALAPLVLSLFMEENPQIVILSLGVSGAGKSHTIFGRNDCKVKGLVDLLGEHLLRDRQGQKIIRSANIYPLQSLGQDLKYNFPQFENTAGIKKMVKMRENTKRPKEMNPKSSISAMRFVLRGQKNTRKFVIYDIPGFEGGTGKEAQEIKTLRSGIIELVKYYVSDIGNPRYRQPCPFQPQKQQSTPGHQLRLEIGQRFRKSLHYPEFMTRYPQSALLGNQFAQPFSSPEDLDRPMIIHPKYFFIIIIIYENTTEEYLTYQFIKKISTQNQNSSKTIRKNSRKKHLASRLSEWLTDCQRKGKIVQQKPTSQSSWLVYKLNSKVYEQKNKIQAKQKAIPSVEMSKESE